jgi:hypothetical protein
MKIKIIEQLHPQILDKAENIVDCISLIGDEEKVLSYWQ